MEGIFQYSGKILLCLLALQIVLENNVDASVESCKKQLRIVDASELGTRARFSDYDSLKLLATAPFINEVLYFYQLASMKMAYDDFCEKNSADAFRILIGETNHNSFFDINYQLNAY